MAVPKKELGSKLSYLEVNEIITLYASATEPDHLYDGQIWLDTSSGSVLKRLLYNPPTQDEWEIIGELTANDLLSLITTVDGSGSGLDADKLDGQDSNYYQNASNLNAGTVPLAQIPDALTGKNADTIDGLEGSQLVRNDSNTNISAHTEWQDTYQARFGDAADLRIQHSGTASYIDNYSSDFYIRQFSHGNNIIMSAENASGTSRALLTLDPDKNLVEGRIARSALVDLYWDKIHDQTASPYIISGSNSIAKSPGTTISYGFAFDQVPRVTMGNWYIYGVNSVYLTASTTTSFTVRTVYAEANQTIDWIVIGNRA